MGTYAGADYNLTLCPLQSRLPTHLPWACGQPYARVDNPMPELTISPSQGIWIWPRSSVCGKNGVWIHRVTSTFLWFNHGNPIFICRGKKSQSK
jgi:hypothetical protein